MKPIEPCYRLLGAKIETGRQRLLLDDVEKFAAAFGTTPKNLMRGIWT